jgi:hypothetical protein
MALSDFLFSPVPARFNPIIQAIVEEANAHSARHIHVFDYLRLKSYQAVVSLNPEEKKEFFFGMFPWITGSRKEFDKSGYTTPAGKHWIGGSKMMGALLHELSWTDDELLRIAEACKSWIGSNQSLVDRLPCMPLMACIEACILQTALNPTLEKALKTILIDRVSLDADEIRHNERVYFLLQGKPEFAVNAYDSWGKAVLLYLEGLQPGEQDLWMKLLTHARRAAGKSQPSRKWIEKATPLLEGVGHALYTQKLAEWLKLLQDLLNDIHKKNNDYRLDFLREDNHDIVKALIWCAGLVNDLSLNRALDEYATWAYKKKPGIGPISGKTGTACMYAFTLLPLQEGVTRLTKFRNKIRNNTLLKSIDKFILAAASAHGMSRDEMEELSMPDFGIRNGQMLVPMAGTTAHYAVQSGQLTWYRDGKMQKSIPADAKVDAADAIKHLKSTIKEISSLLPVVKDRIEQSYLRQRTWAVTEWRERYIDHPLASIIARKLIWHFNNGSMKGEGMYVDGRVVDVAGQCMDWITGSTIVQLWHPIGFATGAVVAWRNFLSKHHISQPFKQAYREVYILTDAELRTAVYSNRFAAHILRQHQFAALCRLRGWQYHLMGQWDSVNTPTLYLPGWDITAHYFVEATIQETNAAGIYNYASTDQVRFTRAGAPLPLHDVPALVFTEVMRDVDLFVGVASLGNDPAWQDGGDQVLNGYWRQYSFSDLSESAQIRSQVLQGLIPRLKIAQQCSFDKKFLIVKGKVRTYKIHLGSGNILMEPNDQYLCIVPDGTARTGKEQVFLPFEGDNLLSIILSKALLLAADDKITDSTILSQIRR